MENNLPDWAIKDVAEKLRNESKPSNKSKPNGLVLEPCPAAKKMFDQGVPAGERNGARQKLASFFKQQGMCEEEIEKKLLEFNQNCSEPINEDKVKSDLKEVMKHDYRIGCSTWKGFCDVKDKKECSYLTSFKELIKAPEEYEQNVGELGRIGLIQERTKDIETKIEALNKIKIWREPVQLFIEKCISHGLQHKLVDGSYLPVVKNKIYQTCFAVGNQKKYIITDGSHSCSLGDSYVVIEPYDSFKNDIYNFKKYHPDLKTLQEIAKEYHIPLKEKQEDMNGNKSIVPKYAATLIDEIDEADAEDDIGIFFKLAPRIPELEIKKLTKKEITELIKLALTDNMQKDEKLMYAMKAKVLRADPENISPQEYAPYNDHDLYYTRTKGGKTFTANKLGKNLDRASIPNLLGSDNMKDKHTGELDGQTEPFFLDEVNEEKDQNIFSKLFGIMERGEAVIAVGRGLITKTWSSLSFMGNPRLRGEINDWDTSVLRSFLNTLETLSENTKALGSRISCIVYNPNSPKVTGTPLSHEEQKRLLIFLISITENYSKKFSLLFKNPKILEWLNNPSATEHYIEQIKKFSTTITLPRVKDFFEGFVDNTRHMKGKALKHGFLECLPEYIINDKMDIDVLLKKSEEHLIHIMEINLESVKNITESFGRENTEILKQKYNTITPLPAKIIFDCLVRSEIKDRIIVLDVLKDTYLKHINEWRNTHYKSWGEITKIVENNGLWKECVGSLKEFDVSLEKRGHDVVLVVLNTVLMEKMGKISKAGGFIE